VADREQQWWYEAQGIHPAVLEHIDNLLKFVGPGDET